jgi:hypothetical protein
VLCRHETNVFSSGLLLCTVELSFPGSVVSAVNVRISFFDGL